MKTKNSSAKNRDQIYTHFEKLKNATIDNNVVVRSNVAAAVTAAACVLSFAYQQISARRGFRKTD